MRKKRYKESKELQGYTEDMMHAFLNALHNKRPFLETDDKQSLENLHTAMGSYVDRLLNGLEVLYKETKKRGM